MRKTITLYPHQQDIFERVQKSFRQGVKRPLVVAGCGSGKSFLFAKMCELMSEKGFVLVLVHRIELKEQHLALFEQHGINTENILVESVFTVVRRLESYPKPIAIVLDEAHLSKARSWEKVIEYFDTYVIGFTATPTRLDGKPLGDVYEKIIEGNSVQWLIENKYLSPYRYYAPLKLDLTGVKKTAGDYSTSEVEQKVMKRAIYDDVIKRYKELASDRKTIVYCVSVKHSKKTAEEFRTAGFKAEHLDGTTPAEKRRQVMQDFRDGKVQILCNCMLFVEGISVSDCDCCVLLRPTQSLALFIQSSMRCMRYLPGKEALILDFVGNFQRHGLPDDDREWSLQAKLSPRKEYGDDGKLLVTQCENCFATYLSANVCPYCGAERELTQKELENIKEIELQEIKRKRIEKMKSCTLEQCRTLQDYQDYAKAHDKSSGWAWYAWKRRGSI